MKTRKLEKGELTTIIIFGLFSIILLVLSLRMFMEDTSLSSPGAFPLLLSSLMIIMTAIMLGELRKYSSSSDEKVGLLEKIKATYNFLFPGKISKSLILVVIYAIVLPLVGFVISTFLFLWITMIMLKKEDIKKSLLASIVIVLFILVIFQYIFKVILP